jgi:phosphoribosylaminoimidazolecarboxamide formyltransferase/IMP cyclohydrolase
VKTLQPKVHAGILARRDLPEHVATLKQHNIPTIDLVVVNLYPSAPPSPSQTAASKMRSKTSTSAAGHGAFRSQEPAHVAIVTDAADYSKVLAEMKANGGAVSDKTRLALAKKAFSHRSLRWHDQQLSDCAGRRRQQAAIPRGHQFPVRQGTSHALR